MEPSAGDRGRDGCCQPPCRCYTHRVTTISVRLRDSVSGKDFAVRLFHSQLQAGLSRRFLRPCFRFSKGGGRALAVRYSDGNHRRRAQHLRPPWSRTSLRSPRAPNRFRPSPTSTSVERTRQRTVCAESVRGVRPVIRVFSEALGQFRGVFAGGSSRGQTRFPVFRTVENREPGLRKRRDKPAWS